MNFVNRGILERIDHWKGKKQRKKNTEVHTVAMLALVKKVEMKMAWKMHAMANRAVKVRSSESSVFAIILPY